MNRFLLVLLIAAGSCVVLAQEAEEVGRELGAAQASELLREREAEVKNLLGEAAAYMADERYVEAAEAYTRVLELAPTNGEAARGLRRAKEMAVRTQAGALLERGEQEFAAGRYDSAVAVLREALAMDPGNGAIRRALDRAEAAARGEGAAAGLGIFEPASSPERIAAREKSAALIDEGMKYYSRGLYAEAIERWSEVLELLPPGEKLHRRALDYVQQARLAAVRLARERMAERREENIARMDLLGLEAWQPKVGVAAEEAGVEAGEHVVSPAKRRMYEELEKTEWSRESRVVLDKNVRDVLMTISQLTQVNIALHPDVGRLPEATAERRTMAAAAAAETSPNVSVYFKDISVIDAIRMICEAKGLQYEIGENQVYVAPLGAVSGAALETAIIPITGSSEAVQQALDTFFQAERDRLSRLGGTVAAGARYTVKGNILTITDRPEMVELARQIVRALDRTPDFQVEIKVKFLEVSEGAVNSESLRFVTSNMMNPERDILVSFMSDMGFPVTPSWYGEMGGGTEGVALSITRLTDTEFSLVFDMLTSKLGGRVLSEPRVVVMNNQEATIIDARSFYYTNRVDIEEYPVEIETTAGTERVRLEDEYLVVEDPESRIVGVVLVARPSVGADRRVVNLVLQPRVIEFIGYETVGRPLSITGEATAQFSVTQPVFLTREIDTVLNIQDGETVAVGGLIKDERQATESRVPLLGSIPGIRHFFRTMAETVDRKHLLIFATATLIRPDGSRYNL